MSRFKIAQYIALGATAFSVIGVIILTMTGAHFGIFLMGIGFIAGLVSYIFGGLVTALKMAGGIAKWGWFVLPFPYDIVTFILAFAFSVFAFVRIAVFFIF